MNIYLQGLTMGLAYVAPIGLQNLFVINSALTQKRSRVYITALIVIFWDISLGVACFLGAGALMQALPWLQKVILGLGSLIVIYIGIGLLRSKASLEGGRDVNVPIWKLAGSAFVVTWLNPQAIIDGTMMLGAFRATLTNGGDLFFICGFGSASVIWFLTLSTVVSLLGSKCNEKVLNITNKVSEITHAHYGQSHKTDVSLRIITDHIRSATFMICDGVLPSNEGRGYVLRRLLRRAARHGKLLGVNRPFLYEVVDTVVHENEGHYPELRERQAYITKVIRVEEENFAKTIDGGMRIFEEVLADHKAKNETVFSGADAFKLYDTYGFPIDLTIEMVEEAGLTVDKDAFDQLMEEQRVRARKAREAMGDLAWAGIDLGLDDNQPTEFTGYETLEDEGKVLAIVAEGEVCSAAHAGDEAIIVLDKTPFYAEMGGQVADHGVIRHGSSAFEVNNVQKNKAGKVLHYGKVLEGEFTVGDTVQTQVDRTRRQAIMRAHSATHLVQKALERVLGDHVHQAGSLVDEDYLRFDFTHFSAMTQEELMEVERLTNESILEGYPVQTKVMALEDAKKTGATAQFGEKYGSTVRVVDMGGYSLEFCGGTHLDNTAKAGAFHILSEGSVASGVRRIEATTGQKTLNNMLRMERQFLTAADMLKVKPEELANKLEQQLNELKEDRKTIERFQIRERLGKANNLLISAKQVQGLKVITSSLDDMDVSGLRSMGDFLRDKGPNIVAVLACVHEGKITLLAACGKDAIAKGVRAGDIIKAIAPICGGSGGGKPDSAMGGGKDILKLDDALAAVDDVVAQKLNA